MTSRGSPWLAMQQLAIIRTSCVGTEYTGGYTTSASTVINPNVRHFVYRGSGEWVNEEEYTPLPSKKELAKEITKLVEELENILL